MDIEVDCRESPDLELTTAFLVYRAGQQCVVTRHRVRGQRVLPGNFVEPPEFIGGRHRTHWFQEGDVYRDNKVYVFRTPACRRKVYYAKNVEGVTSGRLEYHPQYLWAVGDGSLHVWRYSLRNGEYYLRPPQLWNVSEGGHVCTGSMPRPKLADGRKAMEDFWGSAFSHPVPNTNKWKGRLSEWVKS